MPTSTWRNIETFIEIVVGTGAQTFLDVGVGNGKWGFLFREYADIWRERYYRRQWQARVEGIEIFEPYLQDHQKSIYDKIHVGDAVELIDGLGHYDMIMAADVIEHIVKDRAIALLKKLMEQSDLALAVSIPLGKEWLRNKVGENEYEAHVSSWEIDDFRALGFTHYNVKLAPDERRRIGFFTCLPEPLVVNGMKKLKRGFWK